MIANERPGGEFRNFVPSIFDFSLQAFIKVQVTTGGPAHRTTAAERDIVIAEHFPQRRNAEMMANVANLLLGKTPKISGRYRFSLRGTRECMRNLGIGLAMQGKLLDARGNAKLFR